MRHPISYRLAPISDGINETSARFPVSESGIGYQKCQLEK